MTMLIDWCLVASPSVIGAYPLYDGRSLRGDRQNTGIAEMSSLRFFWGGASAMCDTQARLRY